MQPFLNIIVPAYNEGINVEEFCKRTTTAVNELDITYEIVFINDGSKDDTLVYMLDAIKTYGNVRVVDLSRNFGQVPAIVAGLEAVNSEIAIIMDCDMQNNPKYIKTMIDYYNEGYDMVIPLNNQRGHTKAWKKYCSKWFYKIYRMLTGVNIPDGASEFRLLSAELIDVVLALPERSVFLKGLYQWPGYNVKTFEYIFDKRHSGDTKWSFQQLWQQSLDGVFSFSANLLKVWFYIGIAITAFAFLFLAKILLQKFIFGINLPGFATIACLILLLNGFVILQSSIMGEYIARIYDEVKGRPLYLVRHTYDKDNHQPKSRLKHIPASKDNIEHANNKPE